MNFIKKNWTKILSRAIIFLVTLVFFITVFGTYYPSTRPLSDAERADAETVYGSEIDLSKVRVAEASVFTKVFPLLLTRVTFGNTIHISPVVTTTGQHLELYLPVTRFAFVHELAHVWQYQHSGWSYFVRSTYGEMSSVLRTGKTNEAFDWETRFALGDDFSTWNPEAQADAIASYAIYLQKLKEAEEMGATAQLVGNHTDELGCVIPFFKARYCKDGLDSSDPHRNEIMISLKKSCVYMGTEEWNKNYLFCGPSCYYKHLFSYPLRKAAAACGSKGAPVVGLRNTILTGTTTVGFGRKVLIDGIIIAPSMITGDSRCPTDIACIRAGDFRMAVYLDKGTGEEAISLILGTPSLYYGKDITLVSVNPPRMIKRATPAEEYQFTFSVKEHDFGAVGTIAISETIRPVCPVEKAGNPCLPTPEMYATHKIDVYQSDKTTLINTITPGYNGTAGVMLPVGTYYVKAAFDSKGVGSITGLPKIITIKRGETVNLVISIDTGIR